MYSIWRTLVTESVALWLLHGHSLQKVMSSISMPVISWLYFDMQPPLITCYDFVSYMHYLWVILTTIESSVVLQEWLSNYFQIAALLSCHVFRRRIPYNSIGEPIVVYLSDLINRILVLTSTDERVVQVERHKISAFHWQSVVATNWETAVQSKLERCSWNFANHAHDCRVRMYHAQDVSAKTCITPKVFSFFRQSSINSLHFAVPRLRTGTSRLGHHWWLSREASFARSFGLRCFLW